jgi:hypothetical protein
MTKEERNLALDALERIAKHEEVCGRRWGEALIELKQLRSATDAHAARWEKLAWLVITTALATAATVITTHFVG